MAMKILKGAVPMMLMTASLVTGEQTVYNSPNFQGLPLDYCASCAHVPDSSGAVGCMPDKPFTQCGSQAASIFCLKMGADSVVDFSPKDNTKVINTNTYVLDGAINKLGHQTTFDFITCDKQAPAGSAQAGPCIHLHDEASCTGYPTHECFWDNDDNRCEARESDIDPCGKFTNVGLCTSNKLRGCFWDQDDNRCEHK